MASAATTMGDETALTSTMVHQEEEDSNNVADETHNYSYCSENSLSSPMRVTSKPSTRTLIDFWSSPHESGMTMSFSRYEKSSTGNSNSSNGSKHKNNHSLDTSLDGSVAGSSIPHQMKMLLEVTCDDDDRNEVTETTESTTENPEDLNESHQYDTDRIMLVENSAADVNDDHNVPVSAIEKDTPTPGTFPSESYSNDARPAASPTRTTTNCESPAKRSSIASLLPPLPPTARRPSPRREQFISKHIENRSVVPATGLAVPTVGPPTTDTSVIAMTDTFVRPVPFVDTSLSTIHDEVEQSFDRATEREAPDHRFSPPEGELIIPDDDELDLTSIHSEDSDGDVPRNTRHHVVDVEDNNRSFIQDLYVAFPQEMDGLDDDDVVGANEVLDFAPPEDAPEHVTNENGDNTLTENNGGTVSPSVTCTVEMTEIVSSNDVDESELNEDNELGDSQENNRSNDTEHMLANVIDAAEKSILKGQEEEKLLPSHQLEPSMFFDCEEYDASASSSQIRMNESSLPLKFLTLNDPSSPLATINDCEAYENTEIDHFDVHTATSPASHPSEFMFTRVTPLRSNSSRIEDGSKAPSTIDNIIVPPLRKKVSRRKLLPRVDDTQHSSGRMQNEHRKREKRSSPAHLVEDIDDDELSSSVSTLDVDEEKDESTDVFWIDALIDFVSPPEDSRSLDSDSSTSTGTGTLSNGAMLRNAGNVGASIDHIISAHTGHVSSQNGFRDKKKSPTSLSRLREWWQKELIEEVMKGSLGLPVNDVDNDSVDQRGTNDTLEKMVSDEFHKAFKDHKVSLLGSKRRSQTSDQEKPTKNAKSSDWLEALKATIESIESAATASLRCGASDGAIVEDEVQVYDTGVATSPKSFDSLDDLVRELKSTKIETDPTVLRMHFQSMYNQLQQKFKDAQLFDQTMQTETSPPSAEDNAPKTTTTENIESSNDIGPSVEVLPDESLQYLLHSKSPMYSPPTSDYLQQSDDIPDRRSSKAKTRVAKALAQAKIALAQRRRAASKVNSMAPKDEAVPRVDTESREELQHTTEDEDLSVAFADLDISMEESSHREALDVSMENAQNFRTVDTEDDVRVTLINPSSFISDLNTMEQSTMDHSNSGLADSNTTDNNFSCTESVHSEQGPQGSSVSDDSNENNLETSINKVNLTKETVTDNSGSEDSINIASELDLLIVSRMQSNCPLGNISSWQNNASEIKKITASEFVSSNESHDTNNGEYHPLDSFTGSERQWHELSTSGPSDDSTDHCADKINISRSSLRSGRPQSLKMMRLLASDDVAVPKQRVGFQSKALRKAQSYVAMQPVDHNSSTSTTRSVSTHQSDLPVVNGKPQVTKLIRKASLLSILRKKSKKERIVDHDSEVLKETLITSSEKGSDDDTLPRGQDLDWEAFPSNSFYA